MKCFELIDSFGWVLVVNNRVLLLVLTSDLTQLSANTAEALFVYILLSPHFTSENKTLCFLLAYKNSLSVVYKTLLSFF